MHPLVESNIAMDKRVNHLQGYFPWQTVQEKPADECRLAVVVRVFQQSAIGGDSVVQDGLSIVHPGVCSFFSHGFHGFHGFWTPKDIQR